MPPFSFELNTIDTRSNNTLIGILKDVCFTNPHPSPRSTSKSLPIQPGSLSSEPAPSVTILTSTPRFPHKKFHGAHQNHFQHSPASHKVSHGGHRNHFQHSLARSRPNRHHQLSYSHPHHRRLRHGFHTKSSWNRLRMTYDGQNFTAKIHSGFIQFP